MSSLFNQLSPAERMKLAVEANVSIATVNKALKIGFAAVRPSLAQRIRNVLRAQGISVDSAGAELRSGEHKAVA